MIFPPLAILIGIALLGSTHRNRRAHGRPLIGAGIAMLMVYAVLGALLFGVLALLYSWASHIWVL